MRTHVRAISFAISAVPLAAAAVTRRMAQSGADWRAGASRPRQSTTDLEAGRPRPWRSGFTNDRFGHDVMNREGHEERHCFAIFVFVVVQTLFASSAFAPDWIEYRDTVDRFGVDMPKPPTIQEITYTSWRGRNMPARIHVAQDGASRYSVTVINYASDPDVTDVLGSIAFAATNCTSGTPTAASPTLRSICSSDGCTFSRRQCRAMRRRRSSSRCRSRFSMRRAIASASSSTRAAIESAACRTLEQGSRLKAQVRTAQAFLPDP